MARAKSPCLRAAWPARKESSISPCADDWPVANPCTIPENVRRNARRKTAATLTREYLRQARLKAARRGRRQTRKGVSRSFFVILTERMENDLAPEMRIPARTEGKGGRIIASGRARPARTQMRRGLEGCP